MEIKIVLDTNALISATFWYGDSYKIVQLCESRKLQLFISKDTIEEYMRVLEYPEIKDKIKNKNLDFKLTTRKIISFATLVEPKRKIQSVEDDPDDDKFLEAAIEGNCNFIVTSDNHLLKLKEFEEIKIIKPNEFLEMLK